MGIGAPRVARAVLGDMAILENHDRAGTPHRAQAVSDDDPGAPGQEPVDGALQQPFRRRVEARRGFVQYHQAGILEQDARKGQELRLTRGEPLTTRAELRIEAPRQRLDPFPEPKLFERTLDLAVGDFRVEKGEIVANAGLKELDVLRYHSYTATQIGQRRVA